MNPNILVSSWQNLNKEAHSGCLDIACVVIEFCLSARGPKSQSFNLLAGMTASLLNHSLRVENLALKSDMLAIPLAPGRRLPVRS